MAGSSVPRGQAGHHYRQDCHTKQRQRSPSQVWCSRHVHKRYSSLLPVSDDLVGTLDTHALVLSLAVRAPACRPAASAGCNVGALRLAHRECSWALKASRLVLGNGGCQPLPSWGSCTVRSYACSTRHFSLLQQCRCRPASTYCHSPRPSLGFPLVLAAPAAADAPVPSAPAPAPALAPALHRCSTQVLLPTHSPVITSVTVTLPLSARTPAAASGQLRLALDRDYVATLAKSMGLINQFIPGSI